MTHDTTDLTNYYTGSQIDTKLNDYLSKTDASNNYYSKSEVDTKLTAASQNSSSGIFIGELITSISSASEFTSYTTTENCIAIFNASYTNNPNGVGTTTQFRDGNTIVGALCGVPYYLAPNKMVQIKGFYSYNSGNEMTTTITCYIFKPA